MDTLTNHIQSINDEVKANQEDTGIGQDIVEDNFSVVATDPLKGDYLICYF